MDFLKFEIAVIGASVAGSVFTNLAARSGARVALIDPRDFSKKKACGEGLSIVGQQYLEMAGLWGKDVATSARPFFGYSILRPGRKPFNLRKASGSTPQGFGVPRHILDRSIYDKAGALPNVKAIKERVSGLSRASSGWEIKLSTGTIIEADLLVCACSNALTQLGLASPDNRVAERRVGCSFWFQGSWKDSVPDLVIVKSDGALDLVITPLSESEINLSIMAQGDLRLTAEKFSSIAEQFALEAGFKFTHRSEAYGAAEVNSLKRDNESHGCYFIGDAAERFDPIGGMGMSHAIVTGSLAAESVSSIIRKKSSKALAIFDYNRSREYSAKVFRILTKLSIGLNSRGNYLPYLFARYLPTLTIFSMGAIRSIISLLMRNVLIEPSKKKSSYRVPDTIFENRKEQGI